MFDDYLDQLRADLAAHGAYPSTGTITRTTPSGGGFLDGPKAATPVAVTPCRVTDLTGTELARAERLATRATTAVTVPYGTPVTTLDRITVNGRVFEVLWVPAGDVRGDLRCLCTEAP